MEEKPAKPKRGATSAEMKERLKPCSITEQYAFNRWMQMEVKKLTGLHKLLKAEGHRCSLPTLKRWSSKGEWQAVASDPTTITSRRVLNMIDALKMEAAKVNHEVYTGLQARLLVRLGEAVVKVVVDTPQDVVDLIKAAVDIRQLVHDAKGISIQEGVPAGSNVTSLGTFKYSPPKVAK